MFARFNVKISKDFYGFRSKMDSLVDQLDFAVEYAADLNNWSDIAISQSMPSEYYLIGKQIYEQMQKNIYKSLDNYIGVNGVIDGCKLEADWFPKVQADVFLSHSHKDEELAIKLAGWLYDKFKLTTFIDSCIWGYSDNLIRRIDDKYCKNCRNQTYYYKKRNISTSHVHMMLMNALMKMIDKSECVFFINTDNSVIRAEEEITKNLEKTYSPWIYSEINATNLIRKKPLVPRKRNKGYLLNVINESKNNDFLVNYSVDLSKMYEINDSILNLWEKLRTKNKDVMGTNAFDKLYELTIYDK